MNKEKHKYVSFVSFVETPMELVILNFEEKKGEQLSSRVESW